MSSLYIILTVTLFLSVILTLRNRALHRHAVSGMTRGTASLSVAKKTIQQQFEVHLPLIMVTIVTVGAAFLGHAAMMHIFPSAPVMALIVAISLLITVYLILIDVSHLKDRKFEQQLIESIDVMRSALNAHLGMRHALQLMSDTANGKLKKELQRMLDRYDAGQSVDQNVKQLLSKHNGGATRMFCHALVVYDEDGVDLSHLLNETSRLLRERLKTRHQIETQLAGTKYAAIFAGVLPYLLIPVFVRQEPAWFESLTSHPFGAALVTGGVLMQTFGALWLRRSTRVQL